MPFDSSLRYAPEPVHDLPLEPWRKVLNDAADTLQRIGWSHDAPHCIQTVMTGGYAAEKAACQHFAAYLGLTGQPVFAIWNWNDTPGRTAAEVCDALRNCAKAG